MTKRVIFNADDYGLSDQTSRAIIDCFRKGILSSTSILSCQPFLTEAQVGWLREDDAIGKGVHLSLTLGRPLNRALLKYAEVVDPEGIFRTSYCNLLNFCCFSEKWKDILSAIEIEFDLQIRRVIDCGFQVDHLDSQHHIHMIPPLSEIVGKLAAKYGIVHIRHSVESLHYVAGQPGLWKNIKAVNILKGAVLEMLGRGSRGHAPRIQFFGVLFSGRTSCDYLAALFRSFTDSDCCEIAFHPGYVEGALSPEQQRYAKFLKDTSRQKEIDILIGNRLKDLLNSYNVSLCRYGDINVDEFVSKTHGN